MVSLVPAPPGWRVIVASTGRWTADPTVGRREHPGLKYSTNLDLYQPMCVRCHRRQDAARRAA